MVWGLARCMVRRSCWGLPITPGPGLSWLQPHCRAQGEEVQTGGSSRLAADIRQNRGLQGSIYGGGVHAGKQHGQAGGQPASRSGGNSFSAAAACSGRAVQECSGAACTALHPRAAQRAAAGEGRRAGGSLGTTKGRRRSWETGACRESGSSQDRPAAGCSSVCPGAGRPEPRPDCRRRCAACSRSAA